jgi:WD40 repeat protein
VAVLEGHGGHVYAVCVSPEGRYAVSGSQDRTVRLWDLRAGKCVAVLEGHGGHVYAVCVSPEGRYAVSGSQDRTVRLWDLRAGKCVAVLEGHGGRVYSASVSPDGRYVLSGGLDGTLVVWELDWDWEFPEPRDWDEGARAYLETFLTLHTLRGPDGTAGRSVPRWQEEDFQQLLSDLGRRGYGWLRPEGVRRKLEDLARRRGLR